MNIKCDTTKNATETMTEKQIEFAKSMIEKQLAAVKSLTAEQLPLYYLPTGINLFTVSENVKPFSLQINIDGDENKKQIRENIVAAVMDWDGNMPMEQFSKFRGSRLITCLKSYNIFETFAIFHTDIFGEYKTATVK